MKEITWSDAFFGNTKLKDIRAENNLNIPEEYNKTVRKMAFSRYVYCFLLGIVIGFFIRGV